MKFDVILVYNFSEIPRNVSGLTVTYINRTIRSPFSHTRVLFISGCSPKADFYTLCRSSPYGSYGSCSTDLSFRGQALTRMPCCSSSCRASWAATGGRIYSITGGEFKSFTRTTSAISLLCSFFGFFPVLFARALEIPVLYLLYTRFAGFCLFLFQLRLLWNNSCFLTCCLHALLVVFISACYVIFTCLSHIVVFIF